MRKLRLFASLALALMASACLSMIGGCAAPRSKPSQPRIERVSVPVSVPCVSGKRPDAVPPIASEYDAPTWAALSLKQKAEIVAAQALRHQSRAEGIDAATGACK